MVLVPGVYSYHFDGSCFHQFCCRIYGEDYIVICENCGHAMSRHFKTLNHDVVCVIGLCQCRKDFGNGLYSS